MTIVDDDLGAMTVVRISSMIAIGFLLFLGPVASANTKAPPNIVAMLQQAAIVEEMMQVCGHTRPELSHQLDEARDAWWKRNPQLLHAFAELVRTQKTSPLSKGLLDYHGPAPPKGTHSSDH